MNPAIKKLRFRLLPVLLAIFLITWPAVAQASSQLRLDGRFKDWEGQAHINDPKGDSSLGRDISAFYWGTNEGESNLYFMLERYDLLGSAAVDTAVYQLKIGKINLPEEPKGILPPFLWVKYRLNFDINDNGSYNDDVDRYARIIYMPLWKKGLVRVKVFTSSGSLISSYQGWWGEGFNKGGRKCEYLVSMKDLGIYPGQPIRMYVTSNGIPNDRVPDSGDIQWAPVPTLGKIGLVLVFLVGIIFLIKSLRRSNPWNS